jgi:hypothetical protein
LTIEIFLCIICTIVVWHSQEKFDDEDSSIMALIATTLLCGSNASADLRYVPNDSSVTVWSIGAGVGIPYGVIGGKASFGKDQISGWSAPIFGTKCNVTL